MSSGKYRRRGTVPAIQVTKHNHVEIGAFTTPAHRGYQINGITMGHRINTDKGVQVASPTDWIIRADHGKFYVFPDSDFQKLYEEIEK